MQRPKIILSTHPLAGICKLIGIAGWSITIVSFIFHFIPVQQNVQNIQSIHLIKSAIMTFIVFICTSLYYILRIEQKSLTIFFQWRHAYHLPILLSIGLILCVIVIELLILHGKISFIPDWLGNLKIWIKKQEAIQSTLEQDLLTFTNYVQFLYGIGVVALLPSVGEELFFRGLLQNLLYQITKNHHSAISITALIFSIVHYRPYHFIMLLMMGILLGYIYYLTTDLLFVMVGHFANNLLVLIGHFWHFTIPLEEIIKGLAPLTLLLSLIFFFLLTLLLLYRLQHYNKKLPHHV